MTDIYEDFVRRTKEVAENDIREMQTIARANHWEEDLFIEEVVQYINKLKNELEKGFGLNSN